MITNFKLFEINVNDLIRECNRRIIKIIRSSGYIVHYHSNIYKSTLDGKKELISTTYKDYEDKYSGVVFYDTYSFFKNNFNPENYGDEYFIYPITYLQQLKKGEAFNYQELPFFDELFEVLDFYNKQKQVKKFKI